LRNNLIIARVGDRSLHSQWFNGGARNWDLALSCFGKEAPARREECVIVEHEVGPKWPPLLAFVERHSDLVKRYRYVMFPDDDLLFSTLKLNRFFEFCAKQSFAIAQPSLDFSSYYSHSITVKRPLLSYRITNFVEVMSPCFRRDILEAALPSFGLTRSGWGIDDTWSNLLSGTSERMAIVDEISMTHTRPVGGELYKGDALRRSPADEYDELKTSVRAIERRKTVSGHSRSGAAFPQAIVKGLGLLSRFCRRSDGEATYTG
jgi:hypothetical protein